MNDFIGYSEAQIIHEMGERFRDYRQALGRRQTDIAEQSGVSIQTIRTFEAGRIYNMNLTTFLKLLNAIGQRKNIDKVLPELPPINDYKEKPIKRIRKRNENKNTGH